MDLEQRVGKIEERNRSVEADKAWETSWTRRVLIAALTYVVVVVFIWSIGVPNPQLSGLVPVAGFLLSTLSVPYVKRYWLKIRK